MDIDMRETLGAAPRAYPEFTGKLGEFIPMVLVNLLLTVLTLGIYRFWATTRVRRYLWSHTSLYDEPMEWTGTGGELFKGFLVVFVAVLVPLFALTLWAQSLVAAGSKGLGGVLLAVVYLGIFYLVGVAIFRATRYRLSRTLWRGIRGGSNDGGWSYGLLTLAMWLLRLVTLGLASPWASVREWNARWNSMSFGSAAFTSEARSGPLYRRFLLCFLAGFALLVVLFLIITALYQPGRMPSVSLLVINTLISYGGFLAIALLYLSAYYREVVGGLRLGALAFSFEASTADWMRFLLVNLGLIIVTVGLAILIMPFQIWRFAVEHLVIEGRIDFDGLEQSTTVAPGQGEGLADALDIGAF